MEYRELCNIAYAYIPPFVSKAGYINEEVNRALEAIQIAYKKEIEALFPRWISVDEKLPEEADIYWAINNEGSLVRWNYYRIQIDNYHGNIVYWTTDEEMAKILPELPKE